MIPFRRRSLLSLALTAFYASAMASLSSAADEAAGATSAPAKAAPMPPPEVVDGYAKLGFDRLSAFTFTAPQLPAGAPAGAQPPSGADQIPAGIKAYDDKHVIVTGFMLPVKMDGALATEFLLVKSPAMCCYGIVPAVNEWVVVRTPQGVKPLMDVPISFKGTLHVREMYSDGFLEGIYLLDGEARVED